MISSSLIPADGFTKGHIKKLLGNIGGLNQFQTDIEPSVYLGSKCYKSNQMWHREHVQWITLVKLVQGVIQQRCLTLL